MGKRSKPRWCLVIVVSLLLLFSAAVVLLAKQGVILVRSGGDQRTSEFPEGLGPVADSTEVLDQAEKVAEASPGRQAESSQQQAGRSSISVSPSTLEFEVEKATSVTQQIIVENLGQSQIRLLISRRAVDLTEAQWLALRPEELELPAAAAGVVTVVVNSSTLSAKESQAELLLIGQDRAELVVVPVSVRLKDAPNVRLAAYRISDQSGPETSGNANRVANPNETVMLEVDLKNYGSAAASALGLELSSDDQAVEIIGQTKIELNRLPQGEQASAQFLISIAASADPVIPPTVYLTISDQQGRQWFENFYLGEDGAFEYPTGLLDQ